MKKKWVDVLKGLGIILVVVGHNFGGLTKQIIFLFHMPLFFFLSGYLFKKNDNITDFIKNKAIHFIIPYFIFLVLIYFPFTIQNQNNNTSKEWFIYFIKPIIGGQALSNSTGVFWFITCLFITQQLFNLMLLKTKKKYT